MGEEDRTEDLRRGVQAFEALRKWFQGQEEPDNECFTILAKMGLIDKRGLTLAGKQMLIRLIALEDPSSIMRVYAPGEDGTYRELDPVTFLGTGRHMAPSPKELRRFEKTVAQKMRQFKGPQLCPRCSGSGFVITNRGPVICECIDKS